MVTLGIDLAAQKKRTAACLIQWYGGRASVESIELQVDDERLLALSERSHKVGLDVPFGWPDAFVAALVAHRDLEPWPDEDKRNFRFRRTDLFVQEQTGRWPLSVSTDKIGVPALRAARLLSTWNADRSGAGKFVEVYPRAARDCFNLGSVRSLNEVRSRVPWLDFEQDCAAKCEASEDCFDALIASLVARAAALGLCEPIPERDRNSAEREGWIALPLAGSLDRLSSSSQQ